jgi:two-component system, OmpR family, phosphate regulon sensor histidine kinase PhoR
MRRAALTGDGQLVVLTDRTAREAVDRMRTDFVANASHELRTPLAAILGFIETLSDPDAGGDTALRARFLGVMDKEARRMQQLVEDLLSVSRIEASKGQVPDTRIDIAQLARRVTGEIAALGTPRSADIVLNAPDPVQVRADEAQLTQLIHNIVSNAMKYGRAGTPVSIAVRMGRRDMAEIAVRDEGDGIPADQLPRLTERFYRVDSARSRTMGGTGLGLAIVKHVVERHRGRLDIASEEGVGTTVTVRLPRD